MSRNLENDGLCGWEPASASRQRAGSERRLRSRLPSPAPALPWDPRFSFSTQHQTKGRDELLIGSAYIQNLLSEHLAKHTHTLISHFHGLQPPVKQEVSAATPGRHLVCYFPFVCLF